MANVILENDLANKEFENSTEGYEAFSKKVSEYTPEKAEKITEFQQSIMEYSY